MKPSRICAGIALAMVLVMCTFSCAQADGITDMLQRVDADLAGHNFITLKSGGAQVAESADASAEPENTAEEAATSAPVVTAIPATDLDGLRLNLDTLAVELDIDNVQHVRVTELELLGAGEDVNVEWYVSSHSGSSASVELEPDGTKSYVYARPNAAGESEYDITCCATNLNGSVELTARLALSVADTGEEVPARIDGVELIYRMQTGENMVLSPSNAASFPQDTAWTLTARQSGLNIDAIDDAEFSVSSVREGRYIALLKATTPAGTQRMSYIMFVVGEESDQNGLTLNYSGLDIVLDMDSNTGEAIYFIQPSDELMYLPAEWTLTEISEGKCAELSLEDMTSCVALHVSPLEEGDDTYMLTCEIASLDQSVTIPVSVRTEQMNDDVTGISLKNISYTMSMDEAITIAPYLLPDTADMPAGTKWSASQSEADTYGQLNIDVDAENGQTTIVAYHPGTYTVEFMAEVAANRVYTTSTKLIVVE